MKNFNVRMNLQQVSELYAFCMNNELKTFYFAKDQGAYFGANVGDESCIHYMKGCDPSKDEDWFEVSKRRYGGDDFGEFFEVDTLRKFLLENKKHDLKYIEFRFLTTQIKIVFLG